MQISRHLYSLQPWLHYHYCLFFIPTHISEISHTLVDNILVFNINKFKLGKLNFDITNCFPVHLVCNSYLQNNTIQLKKKFSIVSSTRLLKATFTINFYLWILESYCVRPTRPSCFTVTCKNTWSIQQIMSSKKQNFIFQRANKAMDY